MILKTRLEFETMEIAELIANLTALKHEGFTHARASASQYVPKPPKAKKPNPLHSREPGTPGKIHTHDASPGKIRTVPV